MRKRTINGVLTALAAGILVPIGGAADASPQWIKQRLERIKTSEPSDWKKIPWVASLVEARRLGKQENRPVFLFTHDGNIETGRC
jgi:hypothetical protein